MDLSQKGSFVSISEFNNLTVELIWTSAVDLDLVVFYRTRDGQEGAVCSAQYAGGSPGRLDGPPYIALSGDAGLGGSGGDNREEVQIAHLDSFEQLAVCALNYTDAAGGESRRFSEYDARVEVRTERGDAFTVALDSDEPGAVAMICKLLPTFLGSDLVNKSEVMTIERLRQSTPGSARFQPVKGA